MKSGTRALSKRDLLRAQRKHDEEVAAQEDVVLPKENDLFRPAPRGGKQKAPRVGPQRRVSDPEVENVVAEIRAPSKHRTSMLPRNEALRAEIADEQARAALAKSELKQRADELARVRAAGAHRNKNGSPSRTVSSVLPGVN